MTILPTLEQRREVEGVKDAANRLLEGEGGHGRRSKTNLQKSEERKELDKKGSAVKNCFTYC